MKNGDASEGETITTDAFLLCCKIAKLTREDLELMDIGNCLDYIDEYTEFITPKSKKSQKSRARRATQEDFDRF